MEVSRAGGGCWRRSERDARIGSYVLGRARTPTSMSAMGENGDLPVLWQLRFSHFNEKGRWALDYKRIRHVRRDLTPGTHASRSKRLGGSGTTPLLQIGGQTIGDS